MPAPMMNGADLIDHSPSQPKAEPRIPGASNLVMIDNYDSFTWNVYQYLVLAGASVTVHRNDKISLQELIASEPTQLVISPGPGHPNSDAGISRDAIKYFAGKIPVLGVCMGEQCIFSAFGGSVDVTGEILHGKTSPLKHDGRGLFVGLPQDIPVTRYHSLAGTHPTLPECLEVSSWVSSGPDPSKGIIMGVRHRELVVEGVQFHPESILTAEGMLMLKNFLKLTGGTWKETSLPKNGVFSRGQTNGTSASSEKKILTSGGKNSILKDIYDHRMAAVEIQKTIPSQRLSDLQAIYEMGLSPPLIRFADRVRSTPFPLALAAEVKRASPSKGDIAPFICAPAQAKKYALAGASVISVLTEPKWFRGNIEDLRGVRQALEGMPHRPAILRKEFIFDEYQILEARIAGADTVLLIVKMLSSETLRALYDYSCKLGMEPLVEINTLEELDVAIKLGARVIGINNRDLTNFEVDLETTSRLMKKIPKDTVIFALSGISGPKDVKTYQDNGVGGVLVGEALMRQGDTAKFIKELMGNETVPGSIGVNSSTLVKICGTRTAEAAKVAITSGADLIGMILVQGRKRTVSTEIGLEISKVVHETSKGGVCKDVVDTGDSEVSGGDYFDFTSKTLHRSDRALLVGVFQNQPLSFILDQQRLLELDIVQLHGNEPIEWASLIPVPVIRRFGPSDPGVGSKPYHFLPLLDSATGGTGEQIDYPAVKKALKANPSLHIALAGGLSPENVTSVLHEFTDFTSQIAVVDVSTGVELDGSQSLDKIQAFIHAVKQRT